MDSSGGSIAKYEIQLARWSETLAAIARTGLAFTQNLYERERYEEVLQVAADIKASLDESSELRRERGHYVQEWMDNIGEGVPGYVTPKVAIGAIVGSDASEILLVKRAPSGFWLFPSGWADVGYSAAEVVVKEVREETGIDAEPVQLLGVVDGMRMGFTKFGMYLLLFHCRATGGDIAPHPLETSGCGWFTRSDLPTPLAGAEWWVDRAFAAIDGERFDATFDLPRAPIWRGDKDL
ncbi:MAG: NUDIX hydrolase N-terminal domain-containing protein [Actinomycetota bacterium]